MRFLLVFLAIACSALARPNILYIMSDDHASEAIGAYGSWLKKFCPTPTIDRLAAEGMRFTNVCCNNSICSPSRASIISGQYSHVTGALNLNCRLKEGAPSYIRELTKSGYQTCVAGKWHMQQFPRGASDYAVTKGQGKYFNPTLHRPDGTTEKYEGYYADRYPDRALKWLKGRNKDKPFFLLLAYNAVHSPMQGADAYMEKFAHIQDIHRRIFAAMLSNMDNGVGAVLAKLRREQLEENTLIFFLSDNGGPTRELTSSNKPLRDGKGSVYEGGLRVPFMAQWPGRLAKGKVYEQPVISLDIFATASVAAGGVSIAKPQRKLDGVNLIPFLTHKTKAAPHEKLFWRQDRRAALRMGNWKLLRNPRRGQSDEWQLYNLANDIAEQNNLATENKAKREELLSAWRELNAEMVEPLWQRK